MKFKKIIFLLLLILSFVSVTYSLDLITKDDYETATVIFNGKTLDDKASAKIIDGKPMIPMRTYFEILGASIKWVDSTREVISYRNNNFIKIKIDSD
ncbi:MAG: stalk domain-containing protein, partial [Acidaminobacteraceae bacterium]